MKQNDPKFALSLVTQATPYVAVRFIRLIAFTQLGEFEKALDIIYRTIEGFKLDFSSNKPYFGLQMIEDLKKSIEKSGKENELTKFNKLYQELETLDLINDTVSFIYFINQLICFHISSLFSIDIRRAIMCNFSADVAEKFVFKIKTENTKTV